MAVATHAATSTNTLRIGLFDPGMTMLHRVGLGGLWLTLEAIDRHHPDVKAALQAAGGEWSREATAVELRWIGDGAAFFETLIRESFRLTDDGRFWFLGLGHPNDHDDRGVTLQDALLNTFLQHGQHRKADASNAQSGALTIEIDGQSLPFRFRRVTRYEHQRAALQPARSNDLKGWQFPGGAVRHNAFVADTGLDEDPGPWLALLFAPVGAIYFRIRRRTVGVRPQFCIALPDLDDLDAHARARRYFLRSTTRDLVVSGTADAALRVLATLAVGGLLSGLRTARCQVISFGVVAWASQQKTRVDVVEVDRRRVTALRLYNRAVQLLPAVRRQARPGQTDEAAAPGQPEWDVSPVLDLMAGNLIEGRPWWRGFTGLVTDRETWAQLRGYSYGLRIATGGTTEGGLAAVIKQDEAFDDRAARVLVRSCHEAWRRRMGALAERSRERGEAFGDLVSREFERLRVDFAHCKNAATLRATLTDFWARAGGPIPELQADWPLVLPYLTEERWQEARDLALLALVSYAATRPEADEEPVEEDAAK
ncbi:MAG: type I-MYXAN CRISPR-associated Cas8a1/Cmx1 [Chloroflexi bacterium]|nr:type I-MYXAN CRISPR-associated Cas8a1/Cmx1 [Chloroflexota bacterium]